jgi:hypothetical protein
MTSQLSPAEIIKDIHSLNRIERDWSIEGRLDAITEADLRAKKAELLDDLRERFTVEEQDWWPNPSDRWVAWDGEPDGDYSDDHGRWMPTVRHAYGATEIEAIETLLEMIGEDA